MDTNNNELISIDEAVKALDIKKDILLWRISTADIKDKTKLGIFGQEPDYMISKIGALWLLIEGGLTRDVSKALLLMEKFDIQSLNSINEYKQKYEEANLILQNIQNLLSPLSLTHTLSKEMNTQEPKSVQKRGGRKLGSKNKTTILREQQQTEKIKREAIGPGLPNLSLVTINWWMGMQEKLAAAARRYKETPDQIIYRVCNNLQTAYNIDFETPKSELKDHYKIKTEVNNIDVIKRDAVLRRLFETEVTKLAR